MQASPPAAGRLERQLPFRRSAILPGRAFYAIGNSNGISYSIKKALILQKDESCQHSLYHLLQCTGSWPIHAPGNGGTPLFPTVISEIKLRSDVRLNLLAAGSHRPRLAVPFKAAYCLHRSLCLLFFPVHYNGEKFYMSSI